ncbi:T9SS type B sorting domain-containing protein [Leeuwenhoekiella nanhaiensis]|uniref:Photosynthesis system II assembly factor Ycf48/Hcf136-like domain-containing protein n=1 Tax=Leeuwenhoekiella nanhaiensis TaxID=1655491 RepID=A0A2G1VNS1_9FLAO|nr:T9SS type B sorting domain-containing protein [Leeuwenhoekiella nanhaiensis]PHQ28418.1 hypothetical protein CJ305_15005 [Leeuwenhoekiella nanhaiensis]
MIQRLLFLISFILPLLSFSQWQQTSGPSGGSTAQLLNIDDTFFVNMGNGGVFRSDDFGNTWYFVSQGLPCSEVVYDLVSYEDRLYAAVSRSGIWMSPDKGLTWEAINTGIDNLTFYTLFADDNRIFAAESEGGVFFSDDNGQSWTNRNNGFTDRNEITDFHLFNNTVYASAETLYKTTDDGLNWSRITVPNKQVGRLSALTSNNGVFYTASLGRIHYSTDNLQTWNTFNTPGITATISSFETGQNAVYAATGNGIYFKTNNDGQSWQLVKNNRTSDFLNDILVYENRILTTAETVYVSTNDGSSWNTSDRGLSGLRTTSLDFFGNYLYASNESSGGIHRSPDGGNTWENVSQGLTLTNARGVGAIKSKDNSLFAATGGGIYKSTTGTAWSSVFYPGINKSTPVLDIDGNTIATAVNSEGVYLSQDEGNTFVAASLNGFESDPEQRGYLSLLLKNQTILISTANSRLFKSTDLGKSWVEVTVTPGFILVQKMRLDGNLIYAATTRGVFTSSDMGSTWTRFGVNEFNATDLVVDGSKIYAVTLDGAYVAGLDDKIWYELCEGLGKNAIESVALQGSTIYAGTFSSGVWKRNTVTGDLPAENYNSTTGVSDLSLCPSSNKVNLYTALNIDPATPGFWSPKAAVDGEFDPSVDTPGVYRFSYATRSCGCLNYRQVKIDLEGNSNAGEDSAITFCRDEEETDLLSLISGNPDAGGIWSPALNSGTSVFNPAIDQEGIYTYTLNNAQCGSDSSTITISFEDRPNTGLETSLSLCENSPAFNLLEQVNGNPDLGGIWSPALASGTDIFDPNLDQAGTYTYSISNKGCEASTNVNLEITPLPNAGENTVLSLCLNKDEPINLFNYLEGSPQAGGVWTPALTSGSDLFDPATDASGIYRYTVSSPCGPVSAEVEISVENPYEIEDFTISTTQFEGSNRLEINLAENENYHFSLDGVVYQSFPFFNELPGGSYTVYGKEIDGCGYFIKEVFILDYMRYFSPNGDGYHDTWQLLGIADEDYQIYIYNRYGKFLAGLNPTNPSWDGTYSGTNMPSDDYWFQIELADGTLQKGHFTLKR